MRYDHAAICMIMMLSYYILSIADIGESLQRLASSAPDAPQSRFGPASKFKPLRPKAGKTSTATTTSTSDSSDDATALANGVLVLEQEQQQQQAEADSSSVASLDGQQLQRMTVQQLQAELRARGQQVTGRKAVLVDRLQAVITHPAASSDSKSPGSSSSSNASSSSRNSGSSNTSSSSSDSSKSSSKW
jgi:peptidoglycan DL-endopeptidase CwlO